MNVASLELSKELYQLSDWGLETGRYYNLDGSVMNLSPKEVVGDVPVWAECPTYDLGYLLRKLPDEVMAKQLEMHRRVLFGPDWLIRYDVMDLVPSNQGWYGASAYTPEDAAAKLAIELFKQGVLTRGGDE